MTDIDNNKIFYHRLICLRHTRGRCFAIVRVCLHNCVESCEQKKQLPMDLQTMCSEREQKCDVTFNVTNGFISLLEPTGRLRFHLMPANLCMSLLLFSLFLAFMSNELIYTMRSATYICCYVETAKNNHINRDTKPSNELLVRIVLSDTFQSRIYRR